MTVKDKEILENTLTRVAIASRSVQIEDNLAYICETLDACGDIDDGTAEFVDDAIAECEAALSRIKYWITRARKRP